MLKLINWSKNNIPVIITVFLLAFIPLYPKLPTFDIFGTWVYIRLEDFLVALSLIYLFLYIFIKDKSVPRSSLTVPIIVYWIVGAISLAWSFTFIGKTLANYYPHLAILHFLRRIEYMAVFFLAYKAAGKAKTLQILTGTLVVVTVALTLYGLGQKLFGFPAFLTMNEEFAKGVPLRLPPTARIPSTFGGHYDLAAWLVLVIPIFASLMLGVRKIWLKFLFLFVSLSALGLLLLTASRVSFGVYLLSISVMFIWWKKPLLIIPAVIISFIMLNFVSTASERFYKTFRISDVIVDLSTGRPIGTLADIEGGKAVVENQENPAIEELPKGTEFIGLQTGGTKKTATSVEIFRTSNLATGSGEIATISGSFLIQKAFVYDISITTRFQGEWPKAIAAFKRNILLGSGYSTLSVATDGDYLRMLGETGILGTAAFLGIFLTAFVLFFRNMEIGTPEGSFIIGLFSGIVGLSLNAILIDVFEASKVAFTLWILLGAALAILDRKKPLREGYPHLIMQTLSHPASITVYLIILIFIVYGPVLSGYFVGDDFTWLKWAASSSVRDIGTYFTSAGGFFYRPIPKLWYFLMYSFFWLKAGSYHFVTLTTYAFLVLAVYLLLLVRLKRKLLAWLVAALFGVLAVHHENLFWISGASSLLSALFFFWGLYGFVLGWTGRTKHAVVFYALGTAGILASMLSYDGAIVGPLAIWLIGILVFRKRPVAFLWITVLIPLYWFIRQNSGALFAEGDYAYNPGKLPVNIVANSAGYLTAIFAGPRAVEAFGYIRSIYKTEVKNILVISGIAVAALTFIVWKVRSRLIPYTESAVWLLLSVIMLIPYLGLGGLAERYALTASGLCIISFGIYLDHFFERSNGLRKAVCYTLLLILIGWNISETGRISGDWQKAHEVSKQTLLTMRREFFPVKIPTWFAFVNVPIRYGRAWIFPTGMDDALWHLFRGSQYHTYYDQTLSSAFDHAIKGSLYVLTFENYTLKRVQRDIQDTDANP